MTSLVRGLAMLGQSVWLDDLRQQYLSDGTLARLIAEDGVTGITTNPAIFERAISDSTLYDTAIASYVRAGDDAAHTFERLAVEDVQRAADLLRPTYDASQGRDGYVSLEVSPLLAGDAARTITDAKRLWASVARPNLMIKVPGTMACVPAIATLITAGINVNVTLLFSVARYRRVLDAYCSGLEERAASGLAVDRVASVASLFLSRIDVRVDEILGEATDAAQALRGEAAIACARSAYRHFLASVADARWRALASHGAQLQRLLWASTATKNPDYADLKYVEALIAPDTVTTLPMATLDAYRDHGDPRPRLVHGMPQSALVLSRLKASGVNLELVADDLERAGVQQFVAAYGRLLQTVTARRAAIIAP